MRQHQKYDQKLITQVIEHYVSDPAITQKQLAETYNVPIGTVVSWLRCKNRGLTPFQRYKRNRDNLIRRRWDAFNNRISQVRSKRNCIPYQYGLTLGTVKIMVSPKVRNK